MRTLGAVSASLLLLAASGCGLQPDPPPQIDQSAYSGTGDLMARCMQYGSQSYCEQEIWGGGNSR
jgi:hypothetical protein